MEVRSLTRDSIRRQLGDNTKRLIIYSCQVLWFRGSKLEEPAAVHALPGGNQPISCSDPARGHGKLLRLSLVELAHTRGVVGQMLHRRRCADHLLHEIG